MVSVENGWNNLRIELIRLAQARLKELVEICEGFFHALRINVRQSKPQDRGLSRSDAQLVRGRHLCAELSRVDSFNSAVNEVFVDRVFRVGAGVRSSEDPPIVGFVLRKKQWHFVIDVQPASPQSRMGR